MRINVTGRVACASDRWIWWQSRNRAHPLVLAFHGIVSLAAGVAIVACGASPMPTTPSPGRPNAIPGRFGVLLPSASNEGTSSLLATCLARTADASCFSADHLALPSLEWSSVGSPFLPGHIGAASVFDGVPDPPTNLTGNIGPSSATYNVFLSWRAPTRLPAPIAYVVEAGSAPGLSNVASFSTNTAGTSYAAYVSGPGTLFVRVRSVGTGGKSEASNEIVLTIPDPGIPLAPCCLIVSVSGSTVTLEWARALFGASPTSFVIQASSRSGGPPDLANLATGSTSLRFTANGVAPGTYYIRVLAATSAGISPPSEEVPLIVLGAAPCTSAPPAPTNLVAFVSGPTVSLGWSVTPGPVSSYVVEAGSAAGLADLASADTGGTAGSAIFTGVARGTYYVRVRATNACGLSIASSEIVVVVQ